MILEHLAEDRGGDATRFGERADWVRKTRTAGVILGILMLMSVPFYNLVVDNISQRLDGAGYLALTARAVLFALPLVYPWRTIRSPVLWWVMFLLLLGDVWLALSGLIANGSVSSLGIAFQLGCTVLLGIQVCAVVEIRRCSGCPAERERVP